MINLEDYKSLNDIAIHFFGKANYTNRGKVKQMLESEGIDWRNWLNSFKNKKKEPNFCLFCGKEIKGRDANKKKFCNSSCAAKYNNHKRKLSERTKEKISHSLQERNPNFSGEYKPKKKENTQNRVLVKNGKRYCIYCGKQLRTHQTLFCCGKCQQAQKQKEYIERWKNGEEDGLSGEYNLSKRIRNYLLEKHNYKCEKCGWGEKNEYTDTYPLEIHHIDGDYANNKEENLQVLCPNCHSLTENFKAHNKEGRKGRDKYY